MTRYDKRIWKSASTSKPQTCYACLHKVSRWVVSTPVSPTVSPQICGFDMVWPKLGHTVWYTMVYPQNYRCDRASHQPTWVPMGTPNPTIPCQQPDRRRRRDIHATPWWWHQTSVQASEQLPDRRWSQHGTMMGSDRGKHMGNSRKIMGSSRKILGSSRKIMEESCKILYKQEVAPERPPIIFQLKPWKFGGSPRKIDRSW